MLSLLCCVLGITSAKVLNSDHSFLLTTTNPVDVHNAPLSFNSTIPTWLRGTLFYAGSRSFEVGNGKFDFLFDCFAGLVRVTLDGSTSSGSYAAAVLKSDYYNTSMKRGKIQRAVRVGTTTPSSKPTKLDMMKYFVTGKMTVDNMNVNVLQYDNTYFAVSDNNKMVQFNPETLQYMSEFPKTRFITQKEHDAFDSRFHMLSCAHAMNHPHREGKINFIVKMDALTMRKHKYQFIVQSKANPRQRELIGEIVADRVAYVHSFAVTENYIILFEFPIFVQFNEIAKHRGPILDYLEWLPERKTRISVMRLNDGKVVHQTKIAAMFSFHHINAYESNGALIMDWAVFPDAQVFQSYRLKDLRNHPRPFPFSEIHRVNLPLSFQEEATVKVLHPGVNLEIMSFNPKMEYKPYQYVYGLHSYSPGSALNSLVKIQVNGDSVWVWGADDCYPAEPQFVAAPHATDEDEGVVLSVVLDGSKAKSFLLVLDAKTFQELGRIDLPDRTTVLAHGMFVPTLAA